MQRTSARFFIAFLVLIVVLFAAPAFAQVLTGQDAFTDYTKEKPGVRRHLTVADLPAPFATKGVDNGPDKVERPSDAWPRAKGSKRTSAWPARAK